MVFNAGMNKEQTQIVINAAGGDSAFARLLGIDSHPGFQQRVNNWKRRGMPSDVVLEHYETISRLMSQESERKAA